MSRQPPTPHWLGRAGSCNWCGGAILRPDGTPNLRRTWHRDCVGAYKIATSSEFQRRACFDRDRGICAECRIDATTLWCGWRRAGSCYFVGDDDCPGGPAIMIEPARTWEADHVVPLWSIDRSAPDIVRFWTVDNLQTLCVPCHAAKTAREARERSHRRRPLPLLEAVSA